MNEATAQLYNGVSYLAASDRVSSLHVWSICDTGDQEQLRPIHMTAQLEK